MAGPDVTNYTFADRLRLYAKSLEFSLPPSCSKFLLNFTSVSSPFEQEEIEKNAIFIHVPKAAGRSIALALFGRESRHIPLARYYAFDSRLAERCFKFAFVRNPWSRFYSAYHYLAARVGRDPAFPDHQWATCYLSQVESFEGFAERLADDRGYRREVMRYIHFRPQLDWIKIPGKNHPAVDFVGRFESLQNDFQIVAEKLSLQNGLETNWTEASAGYQTAYTDRTISIVGDLYKEDAHCFGYEFGSAIGSAK